MAKKKGDLVTGFLPEPGDTCIRYRATNGHWVFGVMSVDAAGVNTFKDADGVVIDKPDYELCDAGCVGAESVKVCDPVEVVGMGSLLDAVTAGNAPTTVITSDVEVFCNPATGTFHETLKTFTDGVETASVTSDTGVSCVGVDLTKDFEQVSSCVGGFVNVTTTAFMQDGTSAEVVTVTAEPCADSAALLTAVEALCDKQEATNVLLTALVAKPTAPDIEYVPDGDFYIEVTTAADGTQTTAPTTYPASQAAPAVNFYCDVATGKYVKAVTDASGVTVETATTTDCVSSSSQWITQAQICVKDLGTLTPWVLMDGATQVSVVYKDILGVVVTTPFTMADVLCEGPCNACSADNDGDTLTNQQEALLGTDPDDKDTDDDGLDDNVEIQDTLTDPLNPDTDGGGVGDGTEVGAGADPLDAADDICFTANKVLFVDGGDNATSYYLSDNPLTSAKPAITDGGGGTILGYEWDLCPDTVTITDGGGNTTYIVKE